VKNILEIAQGDFMAQLGSKDQKKVSKKTVQKNNFPPEDPVTMFLGFGGFFPMFRM